MVRWVTELSELYREITPKKFYRSIFLDGELDRKNEFNKGKYVGIACEFTNKKKANGKELVKRYTITDELDTIDELLESENFIVISPISYVGKTRCTKNAVMMYAFAIEIDNLKMRGDIPVGFNDLIHHFSIELLPTPNYIVASGSGLHLYYVFEKPLMLYDNVKKSLMNYKRDMTPVFWNQYVTMDYTKEKIQYESAFQGFRMVGGVTKSGERTRVFEVSNHPVTVEYMNQFVMDEENKIECAYMSDLTLQQAKEKYPDWYEKRILQNKPRGTWTCKRDLYDWWKRKIYDAKVGHRYNCLFLLSIYAIKCGIEREELERDIYEYLEPYDELSIDEFNRFTVKDIADALQAFDDKGLVTYPINSIAKKSGFDIPKNKRNGRKQKDHIKVMNTMKNLKKQLGEEVKEGRPRGSGTEEHKVRDWQSSHPNGKKSECIRETGLSKPTVYKWWK